jgi:hypothetical protein
MSRVSGKRESRPRLLPIVVNSKRHEMRKLGYDDLEDWLRDPNHVYIGRDMTWCVKGAVGSKWHNPFTPKEYDSKELRLKLYEEYILNNKELINSLHELRGKDLACWCKPEGCHGDILLRLANEDLSTNTTK